MKNEGNGNELSLKLLFSILVLTVVLSLFVSYFVVTLSSEVASKDTGVIMANVVGEGDELFAMTGQIKVDVINNADSS